MTFAKIDFDSLRRRVLKDGIVPIPRDIARAFPKAFGEMSLEFGHENDTLGHTIFLTFGRRATWRWWGLAPLEIWISYRERHFDEVRHCEIPDFVQVHYEFETGILDDQRTERILSHVADDLSRDPDFRMSNRYWRPGVCKMQILVPYGSSEYCEARFEGASRIQPPEKKREIGDVDPAWLNPPTIREFE